ncbi:shikimate dehydrogenase family protein [Kitasatospora purpeofusca]|uniref:shikimate dehydrogenase family protein n=1 Tax=Kitasatospora purpeofusca TaxID=67352 RepID=UPI00386A6164|nr:shikimate dehydrogenase [Kitasatospora purpeofusca]
MPLPSHPPISGRTRLFAVLGDPIAQAKAPALLNPLFAASGVDAVLVPVHAPADRLDEIVRGLKAVANLDGLLVTVPHKLAMCGHADELSAAAALLGSTNALRREPNGRWYGDNFDGAGFVRGLAAAGHHPAGLRVALAGAGGAGLAIAAALLTEGAAALTVTDPDRSRVDALLNRLGTHWPDRVTAAPRPPSDVDLAVNATPLGLAPTDPLPFDPTPLAPGTLVADIIMTPAETPLLRTATTLGLPTHPGLPMLTEQLPLYRSFFRLPQ